MPDVKIVIHNVTWKSVTTSGLSILMHGVINDFPKMGFWDSGPEI